MSISQEKLIAFVDGELSNEERAAIEAALASDDELRQQIERERKLRQRLSAAFDPTLDEPVPTQLTSALTTPPRDVPNNVVQFAPKRSTWTTREWGAMAASLAGGLILGLGVMSGQTSSLVATPNGLAARGALAQALETQVAANTESAIRIGVSFRAQDGGYCRTFGAPRDHLAGLACKEGGEWRVPLTARLGAPSGEVRTAGSDTPLPILQAVDQMIAGEPLDAGAERAARDAHWRSRR